MSEIADFILQLHITGNCNLRCQHCYISDHCNNMPFSDVKIVVEQFGALIEQLEQRNGNKIRAHIHFTGGEPLLHPEINQILRFFISKNKRFQFGIMSNGTILNLKTLLLLRKLHLKAFQVSIDGDMTYHDRIRGKGNLQKVIKGLDILHFWGIPTRVSFTANRYNYKLFPKVAEICRRHKVCSLWSDRYIPFALKTHLAPLTEKDMKEYVSILQKEKDNPQNKKSELSVQNYRALQFLCSGDNIYYCKAGETMMTIDEYGNIMPCRRMPIVCGNIKQTDLASVYENNETFKKLRAHLLTGKCENCQHAKQCKGGERCFTYAVNGNFENPDPCCWL